MATSAVSPIAYRRGEGETFWSFGALVTVKASAATTGGRVAVFDLAEKGAGSPLQPAMTPPPSDPPDMTRIVAAAAKYGIEILGPPGIPQ